MINKLFQSQQFERLKSINFTDTLKSFEQRDYHEKTVSAEEGHLKQWEEFNGARTVLELNGVEARKMLEPAIAKFTDDTFGKGTYDKIWSL